MSSPQKTLHIIDDLNGYGLSRQLELLVGRQLDEREGVRVLALRANRQLVDHWKQQGIDVGLLDQRWAYDPIVVARLVAELRNGSADLLHVWGQTALDYVRAIKAFVPRMPQLATLPGDDSPVGVASPATARQLREEFLAEQALPAEATLIAVAGPLVRSQQIDEAIWHFELVRTLDESVRLLIFGDGPDRHRLERFARLTSEPAAIRFLGNRRDFRELLPHVDLFWHTALASDAIPQPVLEAMAAGVPVIANESPGCQAVIDDGEFGYLVANNDRAVFARQTRKLMHDETHARQLATAAKQIVTENYSVKAMTAAYAERYEACQAPKLITT